MLNEVANKPIAVATAALADVKKACVLRALETADGNMQAAAKALDIGRATLYRWVERWPDVKAATERLRAEREK